MEQKIKDIINSEIDKLEKDLKDRSERVDSLLKKLKNQAEEQSASTAITFMPQTIADIKFESGKIDEVNEKIRMLVWLIKKYESE